MVDARQQARALHFARLHEEIERRLGHRPTLFGSASSAPEVVEGLWRFAERTYLDNPLPSLFKERLFTYLSRFCRDRYSAARHCGYLLGMGQVAGDPHCPPLVLREALALFEQPPADPRELAARVEQLEALPEEIGDWPAGGSDLERAIVACCTEAFLHPGRAERPLRALRRALGPRRHEHLLGLLAFVRAAHYWTLVHPDLELEGDVKGLLRERSELAEAVLRDPEAGRAELAPEEHEAYVAQRAELEVLRRDHALLEESHRRKDEFITTLVHELRNPLAALQSASDLLARTRADGAVLERVREVVDRNTRALGQILHELSDVHRIARGTLTLEWERLDLRPLLEARAAARQPEAEANGVAVAVELPEEPLWVRGDRARLEQVVDLLLANAIEQTPPRGWVRLRATREGEQAAVSVRDSGAGFDPELAGQVFEPFAAVGGGGDRPAGVRGLGLGLVKGLVELHGGEVWAHSEGAGRGADLRVRLPLSASQEASAGAADLSSPVSVLVVEDNEDFGDNFAALLRTVGHEVALARTGAEALALAAALRPQAVICDIGLPDRSGYEVAAALRQDPALEGVLLVGLSGYGEPRSQRRAQEAGFDAFLAKPVSLDEVEQVLDELLTARS